MCALVQSIAILGRVENVIFMPYQVDTLGNDGGPDLPDDLVQTNRAHVLEIRATRDLGNKANHFVLHPEKFARSFQILFMCSYTMRRGSSDQLLIMLAVALNGPGAALICSELRQGVP